MGLFHRYQEQLAQESSSASLFAQRPTISFAPTQTVSPHCHAPLRVYKTQRKSLYTLQLGGFTAYQTFRYCGHCPQDTIYGAEQLSQLAPVGCTFGYDVMVLAGQGLFVRHRSTEEMAEELRRRHIPISLSEVGYLAKKFVVYLALAHRQSAPDLRAAMRTQGGYILHLDGTGEGGGPMLMSSLDSLSEIVLGNVKVPSEKAEQLVPFLEEIKHRYGMPLATVHDMGVGILAAVQEVFGQLPDFVCHFDFLRDLGKDLLQADYDAIRERLRRHGLTDKLLYQVRGLKRLIDQQPERVEPFCQSMQAHCLPSEGLV
ncbi:MAG: transposase [Verrucomicrobiia bacterium]